LFQPEEDQRLTPDRVDAVGEVVQERVLGEPPKPPV
jgi:hypothetical protein